MIQDAWCQHIHKSKWGERRCHSRWSVERGEARYCKVHDPQAVLARKEKAKARRREEAMKLIAELANA